MIKLKRLLESNFSDRVKSLEKEWDRLDSMGNQEIKQQQISKEIKRLNDLDVQQNGTKWADGKWDDVYKSIAEDVPPAAIHQQYHKFDKSFVDYVKKVENGIGRGYNKHTKLWAPHVSPEGGMPTIAYGHKIQSQQELDKLKNGITEAQAEKLLIDDLNDAKETVYKNIKSMYNVNVPLNRKQEEMLTDFAFNLGSLKSFPKFTKAVLNQDWAKAKKECNRVYTDSRGNTKDLTNRNKAFEDRFLK